MGGLTLSKKKKACGKYYYISVLKETFKGFQGFCCNRNMVPLSLDTREEFDCLIKLLGETEKNTNVLFWTGGSQCGVPYTWCSSGKSIDDSAVAWYSGVQTPNTNKCVALLFVAKEPRKSGLVTINCGDLLRQIGESDVP